MKIHPLGSISFPVAADQTDPASGYRFYYRGINTADSTSPDATVLRQVDDMNGVADKFIELPTATVVDGNIVVNLNDLTLPPVNGILRVGLSAVDGASNESDISENTDIPFDDVAPAAPGKGVYTPAS